MIKSNLSKLDIKGKRVFLRADLNIPINNGKIKDDLRLLNILPTINLIQANGGKILLATHIGRPEKYDANLSTKNLITWFEKKGYKIDFIDYSNDKKQYFQNLVNKSFQNPDNILLLENLRFFPEEKERDLDFAKTCSKLSDFYVNDAFGSLHRSDTSITLLAEQFPKDKRSIGLLIEKEFKSLEKLKNPEQPFLIILGGGKVEDKILLLKKLLNKLNVIELCPAIVFTFLKANNQQVGKSLVNQNMLNECLLIEKKAKENNIKILFANDYLVAANFFSEKITLKNNLDSNDVGISIGPNTVKLFTKDILEAKTIFFNGLPGDINRPETLLYVKQLFNIIANSKAFKVIGGGDSAAAAISFGFKDKFDHLSTGGGATLAYLGDEKLPGLEVFND